MRRILLGSLLMTSLVFGAQKPYEFGINGGLTSVENEDSIHLENPTFGLSLQINRYNVKPRFDVEFTGLNLDEVRRFKDVDWLLRASINGVYEFQTNGLFYPYLLAGAGYEKVGHGKTGFESEPFMQGGGGLKYLFKNGIGLKFEAKALQIIGGEKDEDNELITTVGVTFPFGKYTKSQPVIKDSDGDGVMDRLDKCPDTPKGTRVDGSGCPLPEPKTTIIKESLPIPYNFEGQECPVKIDGPDRDRDGVLDSVDQCPNTPCDFSVDSKGCPIKATLRIHFATDSDRITPFSMTKVKKFADFLIKNKGSLVKIIGHTDWRGSDQYNMALSKRRAESVKKALIDFGVSPSRLSTEGRGERDPIADNRTEKGMALNRRIEVQLTYPNESVKGE
ncbi:MAG: hypothetical protein B6D59_01300 [Campylobacteraceae bacterium 4484_4]|nr:MAG: hypothetical protein B6D59_01300 [Campylobacteraceae bacterium 4484_4]